MDTEISFIPSLNINNLEQVNKSRSVKHVELSNIKRNIEYFNKIF